MALPSFLMALAVVWFYGGFRDFNLNRFLSTNHLTALTPSTQSSPAQLPSSQCLIKGNISDSGERIYHLPGGYYYDFTVIEEPKGERWFCTEAEAQAAGWRRSKI